MTEQDQIQAAEVKASAMVTAWARGEESIFAAKDALEAYMDVSGANEEFVHDGSEIADKRKICAQRVILGCISALTPSELSQAKEMAMEHAEDDAPSLRPGRGR